MVDLNLTKSDYEEILQISDKEIDELHEKMKLITKMMRAKKIKSFDFIRVINESFSEKEKLFLACNSYMREAPKYIF